jgi:hypothetical protein
MGAASFWRGAFGRCFAGLRVGCHLLLLPFRIGLRILVRLDALVELYPDNL